MSVNVSAKSSFEPSTGFSAAFVSGVQLLAFQVKHFSQRFQILAAIALRRGVPEQKSEDLLRNNTIDMESLILRVVQYWDSFVAECTESAHVLVRQVI